MNYFDHWLSVVLTWPPAAASWASAFASLSAVVVAIGLSMASSWKARRQDKLLAKLTARRLLPIIGGALLRLRPFEDKFQCDSINRFGALYHYLDNFPSSQAMGIDAASLSSLAPLSVRSTSMLFEALGSIDTLHSQFNRVNDASRFGSLTALQQEQQVEAWRTTLVIALDRLEEASRRLAHAIR